MNSAEPNTNSHIKDYLTESGKDTAEDRHTSELIISILKQLYQHYVLGPVDEEAVEETVSMLSKALRLKEKSTSLM